MPIRPFTSRGMPLALVLALLAGAAGAQEPTTVIRGAMRDAVTNKPLVQATVWALDDSVLTDSAGAFALRAPRGTWVLWFQREGYLDFRFPLLKLTTDTLLVDAVLRPERGGSRSLVCVRIPSPGRMSILNFCDHRADPDSGYTWQGFKHNPWSPWFGRAVDCVGITIFTRDNGASVRPAPRVSDADARWDQGTGCGKE